MKYFQKRMIKTRGDTSYFFSSSQEIAFIIQKCHDVEYGQENVKKYNVATQQTKLKIKEEEIEIK